MMRDGTIMFPNPSNGGKPCNASKKDMGECSRIPMQQRSVFAGRGGSTRICFSKSPEVLSIDVSALVLVSSQFPNLCVGVVDGKNQMMVDPVSEVLKVEGTEDRFDQEMDGSETSEGETEMEDLLTC